MKNLKESEKRARILLISFFFVLVIVFLIGMFWLATTPGQTVGLTLSFAAGLSMIVLPCTLPLVFVIVPLSMGKTYKKGLFMAVLFSLGLITTLVLYGVAVALLGQSMGLMNVSRVMYALAGILALVFGLIELKLIKFELPSYKRMPSFIQKQPDYFKALLLGLFLGNAGIACPNPATYVILTWIAASGNVIYGAALQFVNGIGRALPLIAFSILGILGVNATQALIKRKETITKITGWGLVVFGAFIIVWGIYGHYWFLNTPMHKGWTRAFGSFGAGVAEYECCIEPPCTECLKDEGKCECRIHLEQGHLDQICEECRIGLAEGKGVYDIARRTQKPAFSILAALIVIPLVWYILKKTFKGGEENGSKKEKKRIARRKAMT